MTTPLAAIGVFIVTLLCGSAILFARQRTVWRFVQLLGAGFLVVVVLTHFAEAFDLLRGLGWGLPNSAGHYIDLVSAVFGVTLWSLGGVAHALLRRQFLKKSNYRKMMP
jgi:hypothetical protein